MSGYVKQVLIAVVSATMCVWTACGGGSTPDPCQGATCVPSATEFLYVTALDNVSGFKLGTSGAPTSFQNQSGPNQSIGIVADSSAKFLYLSDFENGGIQAFTINPSSGALTPIAGSPFPTGNTPSQVIVDSSGKFLFVSNFNDSMGTISAYMIDPTTGALTPVPGSPFPTQAGSPGPWGLAIAGGGKYLCVAMVGTVNANNAISVFSVDPTTGVLNQI